MNWSDCWWVLPTRHRGDKSDRGDARPREDRGPGTASTAASSRAASEQRRARPVPVPVRGAAPVSAPVRAGRGRPGPEPSEVNDEDFALALLEQDDDQGCFLGGLMNDEFQASIA